MSSAKNVTVFECPEEAMLQMTKIAPTDAETGIM